MPPSTGGSATSTRRSTGGSRRRRRQATAIHDRLGKVDSAAAQMLERAKDLSRLEQALRPPKARGGFGELLLENLLRDRLPASAYAIQHTFSSGDRVDAVVRAGQLISVDSKFPFDNYQRLVEAENDDERQLHEKAFARDVRNHVDAISSKYIRPEEGTYDFAFMYVPVESVYYELACGPAAAVLQYAHEKRVFPVSPSTFTAYLQVIVLGLSGMQIEQRAQEVMSYVAELNRDFGKFTEDFELVGTHLGRAQTKYTDADKRLGRFAGQAGTGERRGRRDHRARRTPGRHRSCVAPQLPGSTLRNSTVPRAVTAARNRGLYRCGAAPDPGTFGWPAAFISTRDCSRGAS